MKRITAIVADDAGVDLNELMRVATEFKIESLTNGEAPKKRTRNVVPGQTTYKIVMQHYTPEGTFTKDRVGQWLKSHGFADSTISNTVARLVRGGFLKKASLDRYQFVKPWVEDTHLN